MWTSWEMEKYKQLQPEISPRNSTTTDSSLNVDQMSHMELHEEEAEAFDELVIPHDDEQPLLQPPPPPFDKEEIEENSDDMSHARSNTMEANSRRKLNQQFLTLSSLVPNSTKMDKRSILGDALAYLQDLTQQIDTETENIRLSSDASTSSYNETKVHEPVQTTLHAQEFSGALPAFSEVKIEVLEEGIFLLKILCNNVLGAVGRVYRAIEMLDLEITYISTDQSDQETTQTTAFLSEKEKGLMIAPEQLRQHVLLNAPHLGLLPPPN